MTNKPTEPSVWIRLAVLGLWLLHALVTGALTALIVLAIPVVYGALELPREGLAGRDIRDVLPVPFVIGMVGGMTRGGASGGVTGYLRWFISHPGFGILVFGPIVGVIAYGLSFRVGLSLPIHLFIFPSMLLTPLVLHVLFHPVSSEKRERHLRGLPELMEHEEAKRKAANLRSRRER